MRISSNSADIMRRMIARRASVERELSRIAGPIARQLQADAVDIQTADIYNIPIPRSGTGRPLWRRTGDLRRAERGRAQGATVILSNRMRYARSRYYLGAPGGRRIRSPGVRRTHWQAWAIQRRMGWIRERRRSAVLRALRQR